MSRVVNINLNGLCSVHWMVELHSVGCIESKQAETTHHVQPFSPNASETQADRFSHLHTLADTHSQPLHRRMTTFEPRQAKVMHNAILASMVHAVTLLAGNVARRPYIQVFPAVSREHTCIRLST